MTNEVKTEILKGLFNGANLEHAQINLVLEQGTTITYSPYKTTENNQTNNNQQVKEEIIDYVGRLKPMVRHDWLDRYDQLWLGILELKEVKTLVYNSGKQQGTKFNRNLVAQITHLMGNTIFVSTNTVKMANYLEPSKGSDHPVRQKLGEAPDKEVKKSVEEYMKQQILG